MLPSSRAHSICIKERTPPVPIPFCMPCWRSMAASIWRNRRIGRSKHCPILATLTANLPHLQGSEADGLITRVTDGLDQLMDAHTQIDVEMKHEGDRLVGRARLMPFRWLSYSALSSPSPTCSRQDTSSGR